MSASRPVLSAAQERTLLDALITNTLSLPDLAQSLNLSIVDLLNHIASPDLQAKLTALEDAAAHTLRVAACFQLPKVLTALTACLKGHQAECARLEASADPDSIRDLTRERINLRKTATLLLRLARFNPLNPTAARSEPAAARGAASARGEAPGARSNPPPAAPARPAPFMTPPSSRPTPQHTTPALHAPLAAPQNPPTPLPLTRFSASPPSPPSPSSPLLPALPHTTPRTPISSLLHRAGTPLALAGPAP